MQLPVHVINIQFKVGYIQFIVAISWCIKDDFLCFDHRKLQFKCLAYFILRLIVKEKICPRNTGPQNLVCRYSESFLEDSGHRLRTDNNMVKSLINFFESFVSLCRSVFNGEIFEPKLLACSGSMPELDTFRTGFEISYS